MVDSNAKGDRRERELVNTLADEHGFTVMRAPASGSATERELPDVFAGRAGVFYAFEAKSSAIDPVYIGAEEIDALFTFSEAWGARPRIAARFDREDWAFYYPDDLHETPSGNLRVKNEDSGASYAETFEDL